MTKYLHETAMKNHNSRNIDKWIALGLVQRVEQVNSIAEMLSATMDDLSDQMTELESELEVLLDATETIGEKMDEIVELIQADTNQSLIVPKPAELSFPNEHPL